MLPATIDLQPLAAPASPASLQLWPVFGSLALALLAVGSIVGLALIVVTDAKERRGLGDPTQEIRIRAWSTRFVVAGFVFAVLFAATGPLEVTLTACLAALLVMVCATALFVTIVRPAYARFSLREDEKVLNG